MSEQTVKAQSDAILVIGGGISGMTVALEAAEAGKQVYLVEKAPALGGRVILNDKYFPKLCPPSCGLEINLRRLRATSNIKWFTQAEIDSVSGEAGAFDVSVKLAPRFVNQNCTACDKCVPVCPVERPNQFNYDMDKSKAIYLPHNMAFPMRYVIDGDACEGESCAKCVEACPYEAIELNMAPSAIRLSVGAIVVATGWEPADAKAIEGLGFGQHKNVITNVMMERLAAPNGPTQGKIVRPSDGEPVKTVVLVQCAGSRDENYLPYCSSICCMASLKQATYVREQFPDAKVYMYYIDVRAPGVYEDFFNKVKEDENFILKKGKVVKIEEDAATKELTVTAEDIQGGSLVHTKADLVVLASGMVSSIKNSPLPMNLQYDEYGFLAPGAQPAGIIAAGSAKGPLDVSASIQDATGSALEAINCLSRR
jgi:quinone-modifying oxidoreductase subunit QmoA